MGTLEHQGDVDASEDHYQITAIDRETGIVLVNFAYRGHGLHHQFPVQDVGDKEGILGAVQAHYEKFKSDVDQARTHQEPLPDAVQSLIWQRVIQH